jgi:hypothetical protein
MESSAEPAAAVSGTPSTPSLPAWGQSTGKARFVASLETEDRATAERRAAVLKVRWLSELAKARTGNGDHGAKDVEFWAQSHSERA